jgi:hypothetical protein
VASSMYHLRINEPLYSQISNGLFLPNLSGHKKVHVKCEGVGSQLRLYSLLSPANVSQNFEYSLTQILSAYVHMYVKE